MLGPGPIYQPGQRLLGDCLVQRACLAGRLDVELGPQHAGARSKLLQRHRTLPEVIQRQHRRPIGIFAQVIDLQDATRTGQRIGIAVLGQVMLDQAAQAVQELFLQAVALFQAPIVVEAGEILAVDQCDSVLEGLNVSRISARLKLEHVDPNTGCGRIPSDRLVRGKDEVVRFQPGLLERTANVPEGGVQAAARIRARPVGPEHFGQRFAGVAASRVQDQVGQQAGGLLCGQARQWGVAAGELQLTQAVDPKHAWILRPIRSHIVARATGRIMVSPHPAVRRLGIHAPGA